MTSGPSVKIIADSVSPDGVRLTSVEVVTHRFLLSEWNTHRAFCLAGDSVLEFDLPSGTDGGLHRRGHQMTIADFVDRWHHGAAPRANKGATGTNRQPMRERLAAMNIRQINETTGLIQTSNVVDCCFSGEKTIYQVKAGRHVIAGSADHNIWTPGGYRSIGELRRGDEIVVQRKGKRDEDVADGQRLKYIGGMWRAQWQRKQRARLMDEIGGCQKCGSTEGLVIHHIVEVVVDPSRAFDETNIMLLCTECHKEAHRHQHWQAGQYLYGDTVTVDRVGRCGKEETFDLEIAGEFHNFIANGVVVHNSRNSASSRAIPLETMLGRVWDDPAWPLVWPCEQPGMSGGAELNAEDRGLAWELFQNVHVDTYNRINEYMMLIEERYPDNPKAHRLHKSLVNRLLEPFMWHTALISSTEWENFYRQRCSPSAMPEFRIAAEMIRDVIAHNEPTQLDWFEWHTPYIRLNVHDEVLEIMDRLKVSVGRCARTSYLTHDGLRDPAKDIALYEDTLAKYGHWSPLEHVAICLSDRMIPHFGNFDRPWHQMRHLVEHEGGDISAVEALLKTSG